MIIAEERIIFPSDTAEMKRLNIETCRSAPLLSEAHDPDQIKICKDGSEQQAIQAVQETAMPRHDGPGVFCAQLTFDDGLGEIAQAPRDADPQPQKETVYQWQSRDPPQSHH